MKAFMKKIQRTLRLAGLPHNLSAEEFCLIKALSAVIFGLGILLAAGKAGISFAFFLIVGFLLPDLWLREKIKKRKREILRAFPFFLDLLALCVEAGLDFGAAISKIVQKSKEDILIKELRHFQGEIKVGHSRAEALINLSQRLEIPEVTSFASALIQADELGSSIGPILKIQASQMRLSRSQRVEKIAQEAAIKMLFPLLFFIFPVVFIILFGPIIIQLSI